MLVNPNSPDTEAERRDVQTAAQAIGQQLIILDVSSDRDIEAAFAMFVQRGAGALFVGAGAFFFSNRDELSRWRLAMGSSELFKPGGRRGRWLNELRSQPDRRQSPR